MKYWILFILAGILLSIPAMQAQVEETLADRGKKPGGFGGPFFLYSTVGERHGGGAGGGGGFVIDNFFIGVFGQGETFGKISYTDEDYYLSLGYGGLWLGYTVPSHKLVHVFGSMKIGGGGVILYFDSPTFALVLRFGNFGFRRE
jgi:hypothetical protein